MHETSTPMRHSSRAPRLLLLLRLRLGATVRSFCLSVSVLLEVRPIRLLDRTNSSSLTPAPSTYDCLRRLFSLISGLAPILSSMLPSPSLLCLRLMVCPLAPPLRSTLTLCEGSKRIVNPSVSLRVLTSLLPRRPVALRGFTSLLPRLALPSALALLPASLLLVCVL